MNQTPFEAIFWGGVFLIGYIYLGYPLFLFAAAKVFRIRRPESGKGVYPSVTVFIPVYNEQSIIAQKIENTLSLDYPPDLLEIAVASDGSDDGTNAIIRQYDEKGVRVFINEKNEGKNALINKHVHSTRGDILVFTDANSMFLNDALRRIVSNFSDPRVGCAGGKLEYLRGESMTSKGEGLYFRYENIIRKLEGFQGRMVGANGAIYAIRRELFVPIPPHVPNDFFHPLSVLKRGFYAVFDEKARAFEKPTEDRKEEFYRRTRIVARSFGALVEINKAYGLFRGKACFHLFSHKILRWFVLPIMLIILVSNLFILMEPIYWVLLCFQLCFYGLGILGHWFTALGRNEMLFTTSYYFLLINTAAIVGLYEYLRGRKIAKWEAASTTR